MEVSRFHTSLMGGFRKQDVVQYLAEEKQRQEQAQEDLRLQQSELEQQLEEALVLTGDYRTQLEQLEADNRELRERVQRAEQALSVEREQFDARLAEAQLRAQEAEKQRELVHQELSRQIDQLETLLEAARAEAESLPRPEDRQELDQLQQKLERESQVNLRLARELSRLQTEGGSTEGADQLWSLCGKMERTISQMERMLDGPYRMTCYPDDLSEPRPRPEREAPRREAQEAPKPEPAAVPAAKSEQKPQRSVPKTPTVSSLLQRVRRK